MAYHGSIGGFGIGHILHPGLRTDPRQQGRIGGTIPHCLHPGWQQGGYGKIASEKATKTPFCRTHSENETRKTE